MSILLDIARDFAAFFQLTAFSAVTWQMAVMWIVCAVLLYLGIHKKFEPLLLVPIAFVNDHIETLHELDIEYAHELGQEVLYLPSAFRRRYRRVGNSANFIAFFSVSIPIL